jgi:molybdate transport system regulatory protein
MAVGMSSSDAVLNLRIDLPGGRIGPGKIALLEAIGGQGSISAAGRALGMSYRRAWELVEQLNTLMTEPVVEAAPGGAGGGGARLTPSGRALVEEYRAIEREAAAAVAARLRAVSARSAAPSRDRR